MSDKPSLSDWKYPSNPNSPNPNANTGPPAPSAARPLDVAHGRSSSSAYSNANHRPAPSTAGKRGLASINEGGPSAAPPAGFGAGKDLRHRTNASVFAAQMGGGREGVSFPTSPQQAVKMVYSNVRRRSLSDLAYSVVFVGSLLLFAYSVTGVGFDPANATNKALGRKTAATVRKAVEVKIPDSFLPNEAPPDVHQPHGDDSHDSGADYLHDSPDDPKLEHENAHRHVQTKEDALFADGHQEVEQELDDKLNRQPTPEEQRAEEEAEPLIEAPAEAEDDDEDEDAEEAKVLPATEDDAGDEDEDEEDEDEEDEDEQITPEVLDEESDILSSHDHHGGALLPDPDAPVEGGADAITLEDGADEESELDLLDEAAAPAEAEGEDEEDADDAAQDGEAEGAGAGEDEEEEGQAALPEAARRKVKGIRRLLR